VTPAYIVDSDWVIHYLHGQSEVVSKLQELQKRGLALSLISIAELYEGVYYSRDPEGNERHLQDFFRGVSVLGIDEETCKIFGRQRGRLRAKKKVIGDFDLMIGSSALRYNLTLLSNNRKHFELIEGLRMESVDLKKAKESRP